MHKILLAEDDNDMRRFLVKALENAGFHVQSYDNGLSAYQRLREEPFAWTFNDADLPRVTVEPQGVPQVPAGLEEAFVEAMVTVRD